MDREHREQAENWYQLAEQKASRYFISLKNQIQSKSHVAELIDDIQSWKKIHIRRRPWASLFIGRSKKPDPADYYKYLGVLNQEGKLNDYLERSVSYMYLRDLGKDLNAPGTQLKLQRLVNDIKHQFIDTGTSVKGMQPAFMDLAVLYRWAQKEKVENSVIWVIQKLRRVSSEIPSEMNAEEAQRKLIKIIIGVVMHIIDELDDRIPQGERAHRLGEAIKLGYYYGLTYPFIDDLLDSDVLNDEEKERYSAIIRTTLIHRIVPDLEDDFGRHKELITYIYAELREAYEYIKGYQRVETQHIFFEQSYVFFHAQDVDRSKTLLNSQYTNEELYLPIILKSSSSRLIVRSVLSAPQDEGYDQRVFYYGLYNQLADDFADMVDDLEQGAVTPYTYYVKHYRTRPDLINPFELYWAVIAHLIHRIYESDFKTREVILDRAINGLKRYRHRVGEQKYNEVMELLTKNIPDLNRLIQQMVRKAENVDFFDKMLRDQLLAGMKSARQEKEQFSSMVQSAREEINHLLTIPQLHENSPMKELLIKTANYSLESGGKRIRPVIAWIMGVEEYGMAASALAPLFRSLEFMHTASLIFDDLPSQDNAATRRGRPTLHEVHNSAMAELTGIYLIQKGIEQLSYLHEFDSRTVLDLLQYMSQKASEICIGQAMDLNSKGKALTLEQLNMICFYKTGIAFEVSLVAPAILAGVNQSEIDLLKKIAYHAGIAFQIKDDLLDREGDAQQLGKPAGKDVENDNSTFVMVLGTEEAAKQMWEHYCLAMEALKELSLRTHHLKHLLNYIIGRDR